MTADDDRRRRGQEIDRLARRHGLASHCYDRNGAPITLGEWSALFEDKSYQVIDQSWTKGGAWVSTVWLGLDHGFGNKAAPVIFETMVWHDGNDTTQDRYTTEAAAREGHAVIVERYGGLDPDNTAPPNFPRRNFEGDPLDVLDLDDDEIDD